MKKTGLYLAAIIPLSLLTLACNSPINDDVMSQKTEQNRLYQGDVPISPDVIKGTLANGMQYIIRKNAKPAKRAEIRLVVNAGSVLEDDNQQGFAHFAEHMAFNGTEDFKKQEIIEYIESIGMKFGAHLNAHTSFDETVYKLQIPTDNKETLEKGIHILENWAHKISFEPEEVEKERGVVLEERRLRQGAQNRIMHKQLPVLYKDTRYAQRLPIGTEEIISQGKIEDLVRFYNDWYRPDLMSLVAVGDFEPAEVEALFEKYFASITAKKSTNGTTPRTRKNYTIPDNIEPRVSIESDPELTKTITQISIKHPLFQPNTYLEYREWFKNRLFLGMLNSRYKEKTLTPDSPIIGGGANFRRSFGDKSTFNIGAAVKPGKTQESLAFLLTEVNRTIQHGFTETEFTRQKSSLINEYKRAAKEVNNQQSRGIADEYVRHFMKQEGIPGILHENQIAQHFVPTITLAEVNAVGKAWLTDNNRLISITGPDTEKANFPTKAKILALWQQLDTMTLSPYKEEAIADSLLPKMPTKGSIVNKSYDQTIDTHTWTLSNGAKVVLKKTDFKKDSILFTARSDGGYSLIEADEFKQTFFATFIDNAMGVGEFSVNDLTKFMKGKSFKLSSKISGRSQTLNGSSSVKDIEHFLQMLHLKFQTPRKDVEAFNTLIARAAPHFENQLLSPQSVFRESIREKQQSDNPKSFKRDAEAIKGNNLDKSLDFYHQRFSNAANFTFVFVGNIDLVKMENLVNTYIASLPSSTNIETWKKRPDLRTKGKLSLTVNKGLEPKATVVMKLYGDATWSHEENAKYKTLIGVIKTVFRERLREDKGGVYGVRVNGSLSKDDNKYSMSISFGCDPKRTEELISEISTIFSELKTEVVADKYVDNYITQKLKSREVSLKKNGYWLSKLTWDAQEGNTPLTSSESKTLLQSMTTKQVKQSANKYLSMNDSLTAVLLPEK